MRRTIIGLAVLSLALAGCNEETQKSEVEAQAEASGGSGGLVFAYPGDGQSSVPTSAPVFMKFGGTIDTPEDDIAGTLILEEASGDDGETIALEDVQLLDDGRGIQATPEESLTPGRDYELTVSGLSVDGDVVSEDTLAFSTAASDRGPLVERLDMSASADGLEVARITPYADGDTTDVGEGTDEFPVSDLSTFRVQFTEPVDENTLDYGEDGTVQLMDSDGDVVEAEMLARDHHMTVDPDDELTPGETYELSLSDEITSRVDGSRLNLPDSNWSFTPMDSRSPSGERQVQAQKAVTNAGKMALSGKEANSVLLSSTTLGQNNKTIQEGSVLAELGFVPRFDQADKSVPLKIDRGALMKGSSVEVLVGGEVPAGYGSGEIDVRFISDANGYLMPNPYSDEPDAPRIVRLFLDIGMNTGDKRGNGALAQELLHVELIGTAMVEDGILNLEAVSVIEPDVLGVDKASGLISFKLNTFEDGSAAPTEEDLADDTAPTLKSWAPGEDHQDKLQPQDSVSLFFSEPLLPSSVNDDSVFLRDGNGDSVAVDIRQNGANVILDPEEPLSYDEDYEVVLDNAALQDLAGNKLNDEGQDLTFSLPETEVVELKDGAPESAGPAALTTRPGYPCAKTDLSENTLEESEKNGRCLGGITEDTPDSKNFGDRELDERLPIEEHEADAPIVVRFSQNMDMDSINEDTFVVEKYDEGNWESVDGVKLEKTKREVRAIPTEEWETGATYRYRLVAGDASDPGIASEAGNPLYAKILNQYPQKPTEADKQLSDRMQRLTEGGHDLVNRFSVVEPSEQVLTPLGNLPTPDSNGDLVLNEDERSAVPDASIAAASELDKDQVPANAGALEMTDIESDVIAEDGGAIGCEVGTTDCASYKKMIFKTARLDVEVGPEPVTWDDGTSGIPVELDPSVLFTTSSDVWIELTNDFLAAIATDDGEPHQRIPTGPMVMRMRYQNEDPESDSSPRSEPISGLIYRDDSRPKGERLRFKTELDVYLDAPFLLSQLEADLAETNLEDNMRSFEINGLTLDGPIEFFKDGRMQISQRNVEDIDLDVDLQGDVEVQASGESCTDTYSTSFGVELCEGTRDVVSGFAGELINVDTDMSLSIPAGALNLNYITPYTQKEE